MLYVARTRLLIHVVTNALFPTSSSQGPRRGRQSEGAAGHGGLAPRRRLSPSGGRNILQGERTADAALMFSAHFRSAVSMFSFGLYPVPLKMGRIFCAIVSLRMGRISCVMFRFRSFSDVVSDAVHDVAKCGALFFWDVLPR